jgi:transcriptional regulator GlxA family with amidase domain
VVGGPVRVGLLAYEGCYASELFTVADTLSLANRVAEYRGASPPFATSVHAVRPGQVTTGGGTSIGARPMTYALDLIVVPGFDLSPEQHVGERLRQWQPEIDVIERAGARSLGAVGVCVGAFLLAESGLLDGRRATTAWLFADALANRYPAVTVDRRALLVHDGPTTTSGAFSAALDVAMDLVHVYAGQSIMHTTARIALASSRSSQAPYVDEQLMTAAAGSFSARVRHHLAQRIDAEYDLAALAATQHVSTRTLLRRFRAETGQTPLNYLQSLRIAHARRSLESTDLSIDEIARSVGYRDVTTFRRLFARAVQMSPSQYRRSFGAPSTPQTRGVQRRQ